MDNPFNKPVDTAFDAIIKDLNTVDPIIPETVADREAETLACLKIVLTLRSRYAVMRQLIMAYGSGREVLRHKDNLRERIPEISDRLVELMHNVEESAPRADVELEYIKSKKIFAYTYYDVRYPSRLRECTDAPIILFFLGNADLNASRVLSIVGTRHITEYGRLMCDRFIAELANLVPDLLVISGLAYGVDVQSHRACLLNGLQTVGVFAHGLDRVYPSVHRKVASQMTSQGGLLTDFVTGTRPDRYNFVARNRIVAGISDGVLVVESAPKGGSLITADLANGYDREVFAFPGRVGDLYSQGCNELIRDNQAICLTSAEELVRQMNWNVDLSIKNQTIQRELFPGLSEDERCIVTMLQEAGPLNADSMTVSLDIPVNKLQTILFNLEIKGVVSVRPGGLYSLL